MRKEKKFLLEVKGHVPSEDRIFFRSPMHIAAFIVLAAQVTVLLGVHDGKMKSIAQRSSENGGEYTCYLSDMNGRSLVILRGGDVRMNARTHQPPFGKVKFVLVEDSNDTFAIQGVESKRYLCLGRRTKIICGHKEETVWHSKTRSVFELRRDEQCLFQEVHLPDGSSNLCRKSNDSPCLTFGSHPGVIDREAARTYHPAKLYAVEPQAQRHRSSDFPSQRANPWDQFNTGTKYVRG